MRNFSALDAFLEEIDYALRAVFPPSQRPKQRPSPARNLSETALTPMQRQHSAGYMRVNRAGEICAQALYRGQGLTADLQTIREQMLAAAEEETDHLAWCEQRLKELGSRNSILDPFWYAGSFFLGAVAGLAGDKISLGFVAETEYQVSQHLQHHLNRLPLQDKKTRLILQEMLKDETQHAELAKTAGAIELPAIIKNTMRWIAKLMTKTSYYI